MTCMTQMTHLLNFFERPYRCHNDYRDSPQYGILLLFVLMYIVRKGINDYLICHCLDISGTLSVGKQCNISDAYDAFNDYTD